MTPGRSELEAVRYREKAGRTAAARLARTDEEVAPHLGGQNISRVRSRPQRRST